MQPYKQEYKPVLTDKPEVDQIDAALLIEELTKIYSTPTPKGWREIERSNCID